MPDEPSKEKKLSLEETRMSNAAKRFLRQVSISTKNFRMFSENHPFLQGNIRNAHELLKEILLNRDSVTFTFAEGACLIEDIPIKGLDAKSFSILETAKECSITSLTFLHNIPENELHTTLKLISGGLKAIKEENGLTAFLQKKNIANVKADEVFFKKVSRKDEESREAKKHLEDFLVMNYLLGKAAISKDDISSLVGEIQTNPERVGKLISNVASSGGQAAGGSAGGGGTGGSGGMGSGTGSGGGGNGSGSGDGGSGNVGFACTGIEKLAMHIKNTDGMSYKDVKDRVGSLIMALEPAVRSDVLKSKITVPDVSENIVEDIIKEFSNEAITELIVADFVDRKLPIVQARNLIARLLPTAGKRKAVFSYLEERLLKKGVPQKDCSALLQEPFWQEMTTDEKAKKILQEKPSFLIEMGLANQIESLVEALLTEKKFDLVDGIIQHAFKNLQSDDDALKLRLVRDLEKLCVLLFREKEYPYSSRLIARLADEFKISADADLKALFVKLIAELLRLAFENRWYNYLPILLNAIGDCDEKTSVISAMKLDEMFKEMLFKENLNKEAALRIVQAMGKGAIAPLEKLLTSIAADDFDSYKKRHTIITILKNTGKAAEDEFIKKLSSDDVEIVKHTLEVLSEMGTANAIPAIEKLTKSQNPDVQKCAHMAIKHINSKKPI